MIIPKPSPFGVLLDIDGVLYVGKRPIDGAQEALAELRDLSAALRLVTNTTSRPRRRPEHLHGLG
jgi:ribonucleotide monophosphatase NagD (HAD superfamily)